MHIYWLERLFKVVVLVVIEQTCLQTNHSILDTWWVRMPGSLIHGSAICLGRSKPGVAGIDNIRLQDRQEQQHEHGLISHLLLYLRWCRATQKLICGMSWDFLLAEFMSGLTPSAVPLLFLISVYIENEWDQEKDLQIITFLSQLLQVLMCWPRENLASHRLRLIHSCNWSTTLISVPSRLIWICF